MKHEDVVKQLLSKLRITSFSPEYLTLKEMALLLVQAECEKQNILELPDTEANAFINKTKSIDLYERYIEETQYKMRVVRVTDPEMVFSQIESILFDAAIKRLSYYLERVAAILLLDGVDHITEEDFKRLGVENIPLVKKLIEFCPLIEKTENCYFFRQKWLVSYLGEKEMSRFMQNGEKQELGIRRDSVGKSYYPLPQRKARPWDLPIPDQMSVNSLPHINAGITTAMNNQVSTALASDKISKEKFKSILAEYKSKSFLGYLSTFWLFSWLSPIRSQTMRELKSLLTTLENGEVSRNQIENAINHGDNQSHRLGLFKAEPGYKKNGTGTDEVILQLSKAFKKSQ